MCSDIFVSYCMLQADIKKKKKQTNKYETKKRRVYEIAETRKIPANVT